MSADAALAGWRDAGSTFDHRGHPIFFRDSNPGGAEPVALLIHGFPTASWDWHCLWPELTARFGRVIAPDMIGFGFSAKPRTYDYSIADQADLHESLLRRLGVTGAHILAHDYGDTVAQELLARHEERRARGDASLAIRSCCLLNGGLFPETHRARPVQRLLLTPLGPLLSRLSTEKGFVAQFAAVFGRHTQPSPGELHAFWTLVERDGGTRIMHRLIRYIAERRANRARWVGVLQTTAVPLRVIDGAEDPVSGAHMVERYRALVPNPDAVLLPGIGHYPQVEDPAGTLRAFLEFHDRVRRSSSARVEASDAAPRPETRTGKMEERR